MSYHRNNAGKKQKGFGFAGFQMSSGKRQGAAIPPPSPKSGFSKQGYHTMNSITETALATSWGLPKKRSKTEEE